jgi:hypothetical protein
MTIESSEVSDRWRRAFLVEVPICLVTAGYWLFAPAQYLSQAYAVEADLAHAAVLRQLGFVLLSILVWFYGRWLLSGRVELRPFRYLQEGLALGDVFIIGAAVHALAVGQLGADMALAQIIPAGLWLAVRVVFLIRYRERPSSMIASASRS